MQKNTRALALRGDGGQGLVELVVALTILAVGIGALLTVLTSSALSLQRSDRKGTALVLAEGQIELYRNLDWQDVRLDNAYLTAVQSRTTDPYMTAHSSDSSIPSGAIGTQRTDTAAGTDPCTPDYSAGPPAGGLTLSSRPHRTSVGVSRPFNRRSRVRSIRHRVRRAVGPEGRRSGGSAITSGSIDAR